MIGRLRPGVDGSAADAEVKTIAAQLVAEHPDRNSFQGNVIPLSEKVSGPVRLAVWVLAGAVAMVMLIVCANLSNLLLSRATSRQKEFAIRSALGAGRGRMVGQMLTESIMLSSAGALVGVALAVAGTRAITQLEGISIPLLRDVRVDSVALAFTVAVAIAAGVIFGLAPAFLAGSLQHRRAEGRQRADRPRAADAAGCGTHSSSRRSLSRACCWSPPAC